MTANNINHLSSNVEFTLELSSQAKLRNMGYYLDYLYNLYEASLKRLEKKASNLSDEIILDVLIVRDMVQAELSRDGGKNIQIIENIDNLDKRLKEKHHFIRRKCKLGKWREKFKPPKEAWWWWLDEANLNKSDDLAFLWIALILVCLAINLSLVIDISSRLLSESPDTVATFTVIFQAILALIAGGTLTKFGKKAVEAFLAYLKIPESFWEKLKFFFSFLIVIVLLNVRLLLPRMATLYNNKGVHNFEKGNLHQAKADFERAVQIDPGHAISHFHLGRLYEEMQDINKAKEGYSIAAQGGIATGYGNLARLYILTDENDSNSDNAYATAVFLLMQGMDLARNENEKYLLLKDLGWARLKQKRYDKAIIHLREAIQISPDKAPAYCLLAQAMEISINKKSADPYWRQCLEYASECRRDEDNWIDLANTSLGLQEIRRKPCE